jgi:ankyrin repeat protein
MWAIDGGYEECAMLLIHQTSPLASCLDGTHAIHLAARKKMPNVIKALALSGAHLDARDQKGRTALHHACLASSTSCCKELIMHGAQGNLDDNQSVPPWGYALFKAWKDGFELLSSLDDLQHPTRMNNARDFIIQLENEPQKLDLQIYSGVSSAHFPDMMTRAKLWVDSVQTKVAIDAVVIEPHAASKKARL